jgi:hypothetical protein
VCAHRHQAPRRGACGLSEPAAGKWRQTRAAGAAHRTRSRAPRWKDRLFAPDAQARPRSRVRPAAPVRASLLRVLTVLESVAQRPRTDRPTCPTIQLRAARSTRSCTATPPSTRLPYAPGGRRAWGGRSCGACCDLGEECIPYAQSEIEVMLPFAHPRCRSDGRPDSSIGSTRRFFRTGGESRVTKQKRRLQANFECDCLTQSERGAGQRRLPLKGPWPVPSLTAA